MMTHHYIEDWIVTAYDQNGRLHYVITETWSEWGWIGLRPRLSRARARALVLNRAMNLDDKEWIES